MKLNIGCGNKKLEGYINIDGNPKAKPDKVHNIIEGLPFKDNAIDEIRASHVLEHLEGEGFFKLMEEAHRVLKVGGVFKIRVPHYRSENAYCNPFHVRVFNETTFFVFAETPEGYRNNLDKELPCFRKATATATGGCFSFIPGLIPLDSWKRAFNFLYDEIKIELIK